MDQKKLAVLIVALVAGVVWVAPLSVQLMLHPPHGALGWTALGMLGFVLLSGLAIVAVVAGAARSILGVGAETAPPTGGSAADAKDPVRTRLALLVVSIGTAGIAVVSLAVIVALATNGNVKSSDKFDTVLMGIFTAVLPVFATWVGTVLAFYFTNESFRQAAESTRGLLIQADNRPITDPSVMIEYDKITKCVLPPGQGLEDAKKLEIDPLWKKFSDTVTRLPIFTSDRKALYILRKPIADALGSTQTATKTRAAADGNTSDTARPGTPETQPKTISDYLKTEANAADAVNFAFLPANATVDDGRRTLKIHGVSDIFITDTGRSDAPVKGWVPDDRLK